MFNTSASAMDPDGARIQRTLLKILQSVVEESNEVLEKALSKLAQWLEYPRVYNNPHLREQVLCILDEADIRIRKEVGFTPTFGVPFNPASYRSPEYPFMDAYTKLLEAVQPFRGHLREATEQPAIIDNNGLHSTQESMSLPTSSEIVKAGQPTMASTIPDLNAVNTQAEPRSQVVMATSTRKYKQPEEITHNNPEKQSHTPSASADQPTDTPPLQKASPTPIGLQQNYTTPVAVSGSMPNTLTQRRKTKTKRSINFLAKFDEQDELDKKSRPKRDSPAPSFSRSTPQSGVTIVQGGSTSTQGHAQITIPRLDLNPGPNGANVLRGEPIVTTNIGLSPPEVSNRPVTTPNKMPTLNPSLGLGSHSDSMTAGIMQMRLNDYAPQTAVANDEGTPMTTETPQLLDQLDSPTILSTESSTTQASAQPAPASQQPSRWELPPGNDADGMFGPDLRILGVQPGRREHTHFSMEIHLPEADFSALKYWKESKSATCLKDVQTSVCISMACYHTKDLAVNIDQLQHQVSVLCSSWPQYPASGSLLIKTATPELNVPLSPPFHLTPDKLVDLSAWMRLGKNQLGIRQQGMDDFVFVILLHQPTRKQLQQVSAARLDDLAWRHFLDRFSDPIEYTPLRSLALGPN